VSRGLAVLAHVALVACQGPRNPAAAVTPAVPTTTPTEAPPAAPDPPAEPDLVVAPPLPADLATVKPWVYRELQTGAIRARHTLAIYRLHRHGTRAALLVEEREATSSDPDADRIDGFTTRSFRLYVGTVTARGRRQTFALVSDDNRGETLDLPCRLSRVAVARADAVREPSGSGECGDRGEWRPSTMKRREILSCLPFARDDPDPDRDEQLAFAPEPGIEFLFVNDDCTMQGGGYRAISAGGAVANIRATRETAVPGATGDELEALRATLARSITTCFATAKLMAQQGSTTPSKRGWRERAVLKRCLDDKWPLRVRECVATATHDQLACTASLETQRQRTRWNAVFDQW
jgi:hypothetical protein